MRWSKLVVLGAALASPFACADNGQTGSIGYACCEDECARQQTERVAVVASARTPRFVESACREANLGPADSHSLGLRHCQCIEADGTIWIIEATGHSSFGAGGTSPLGEVNEHASTDGVVSTERCLAWGRGNIACVFPESEAAKCSTSDPRSCEPICERWEQGLQEDATRAYDAELRGSYCWGNEPSSLGSGSCLAVVRINDACYATQAANFFAPTPYDCALSDEKILALNDSAIPRNVP